MKKLLWSGVAVLVFAGCATSDHRYARHDYRDRPDVVVERDGTRTYVRDYDSRYDSGYDSRYWNRDQIQSRYRGKHPDALGWNDPYWYHQP